MRVCVSPFNKVEKLHKKSSRFSLFFNRRKRTIHGGLLMFCIHDSFFRRKNNEGHKETSHAAASQDVVGIADKSVCYAAAFLR